MFMISRFMYDAIYKPRDFLKINNHEPTNHIGNFYYFRLGGRQENGQVIEGDESVIIPKNGFMKIWSLEEFVLSERVLGLFGNLSALVHQGLQLIHSPSVDPGFTGALALGIRNNTSKDMNLQVGERIGKILFFDVSDTFINAEEFLESVLKQKELDERTKAAETLKEGYADILKKYQELLKG